MLARLFAFLLSISTVAAFLPTSSLPSLTSTSSVAVTKSLNMVSNPDLISSVAPSTISELPSTLNAIGLDVTFAAYLAVVLGTFVPVVFLITLYIQSESRKAGQKENLTFQED